MAAAAGPMTTGPTTGGPTRGATAAGRATTRRVAVGLMPALGAAELARTGAPHAIAAVPAGPTAPMAAGLLPRAAVLGVSGTTPAGLSWSRGRQHRLPTAYGNGSTRCAGVPNPRLTETTARGEPSPRRTEATARRDSQPPTRPKALGHQRLIVMRPMANSLSPAPDTLTRSIEPTTAARVLSRRRIAGSRDTMIMVGIGGRRSAGTGLGRQAAISTAQVARRWIKAGSDSTGPAAMASARRCRKELILRPGATTT